eukprot:TRINITY_DN67992_c0_g1_i1.p1 TRINITY_DN67992_c0_g1~~TRINITY_DN67992_c0_g1_i1.p1  ORF type:complete len:128 (-),score=10.96 TRINITY_DN67992_c0_g1_i1:54-437(-)
MAPPPAGTLPCLRDPFAARQRNPHFLLCAVVFATQLTATVAQYALHPTRTRSTAVKPKRREDVPFTRHDISPCDKYATALQRCLTTGMMGSGSSARNTTITGQDNRCKPPFVPMLDDGSFQTKFKRE